MRTKETEDGNVALFQRRSAPGRSTRTVVELDAIANRISAGWRNAPAIRAVGGFDDLPAPVQERARKDGSDGSDVAAAFHDGTVWLVASHPDMATDAGVERAVFHEAWGHYGLRMVFGKDTRRALTRLATAMGGIPGIMRYAKKYGIDLETYRKGFAGNDALGRGERQALLLDELAAHIAQNGTPTLRQRLREYLGAIKAWLRAHGFPAMGRMSDLDLAHVLKRARDAVVNGKPLIPGDTGTTFQRVPNTHDERLRALLDQYAGAEGAPSEAEMAEAVRQYREVERAHAEELRAFDAEGTPLPAPNGEATNLNREQWILTRTPNFIDWFGAWNARSSATMDRPANTVQEARQTAQAFVGKPVTNLSTGLHATVSNTTLGKITSESAAKKSTNTADHALAAANADQLFVHAVRDERHPDRRGEPTIAAIHRYVAPMVTASGKLVAVKMTVKETTGPREPNPLYTIETLEIEDPSSVLSRANPDETGIRPQTGLSLTVRARIAAVNGVGVSKVIDDNGEPRVVYHGTNATNVMRFEPAWKQIERETTLAERTDNGSIAQLYRAAKAEPEIHFFAEEEGTAETYGPHVVGAFLNVRHPAPEDDRMDALDAMVQGDFDGAGPFEAANPDIRFALPALVEQVREWFNHRRTRGAPLQLGRTQPCCACWACPARR